MHSNMQVPYSHHPRKRGGTRHAMFAILGLLVMMAGYTILFGEHMQMDEAKSIDGRRISRHSFATFTDQRKSSDNVVENKEEQPPAGALITSNEVQRHGGGEESTAANEQIEAQISGEDDLPMKNLEHGLVQPAQWRVVENGMTATDPEVGDMKFSYVHMAMIAEKPDQRLVLAFQASGVLEAAEDQRIWVMVSKDTKGKQWGEPRALLPSRRRGAQWAPVLHWSARDSLFYMFYAESDPNCLRPGNPRRFSVGGTISVTTAADPLPGETSFEWKNPRGIYRQREGEFPVPKIIANRLVELSSGEWILPFWRQRSYKVCDTKSPNSAGVLRSSNYGKSWKAYGELTLPTPMSHWVIEGSVVELSGGAIMMLLRSTEGFIYASRSLDKGIVWSAPQPTKLLNPDSKTHAIRLRGPQGLLLLAYNNHDRPFHGMAKGRTSVSGKRRDTLMMAVSPDKGESWKQVARLDPPAHVVPVGNKTVNMMFHYPTLLHRASGKVLASYSRSYYPDRTAAEPPHQDGIWLAEIDLVAAMKQ